MANTWSFKNPQSWGAKCKGTRQAPINIDTELTLPCKDLCKLEIHYKPSKCQVNFNNNMLSVNIEGKSYILYKNKYYKLSKITFHTPSLHKIDGEKYDMEICLIHNNGNDENGGIVLSFLYQEGPHHGGAEQFINQFINDSPSFNTPFDKEVEVSDNWGPQMLVPERKSYFVYEGALHHPPCSQNYTNIVFESVGNIGTTNLNIFKKYIGDSTRDVQPLFDRTVYYSVGLSKDSTEDTTITKTQNKILRCVYNPGFNPDSEEEEPFVKYSNFKGCYTDFPSKKVNKISDVRDCDRQAQSNKSKYFALRNRDEGIYDCYVSNEEVKSLGELTPSENCIVDEDESISYGPSGDETGGFSIYEASSSYSFFKSSTKQYIKSLSMLLGILTLIVNAYLLVQLLFRRGHAQRALVILVGLSNYGGIDPRPIWKDKCAFKDTYTI